MYPIKRLDPGSACNALDLEAEMRHWRSRYPELRLFRSGLHFERYTATFKFGYGAFLRNRGKDAAELFCSLCHQYKDGVAARDRIDWVEAEMIVAATWERLSNSERIPVVH